LVYDCRGDIRKCADYMKRAIQTAELVWLSSILCAIEIFAVNLCLSAVCLSDINEVVNHVSFRRCRKGLVHFLATWQILYRGP